MPKATRRDCACKDPGITLIVWRCVVASIDESTKLAVIALGGNSIIQKGERGTITEQFANTRRSMEPIVELGGHGRDPDPRPSLHGLSRRSIHALVAGLLDPEVLRGR